MKEGAVVVLSAQGQKAHWLRHLRHRIGIVTRTRKYWREERVYACDVRWIPENKGKWAYGNKNVPRSNLKHYATKKELSE